MKQVIIGIYEIGYDQVELILREDTGGEFYLIPEKGSIPRIKVGADYEKWQDVVTVLLHESYEFMIDRLQGRYTLYNDLSNDHGAYTFVFDHVTFSDVCARVSEFISKALPDLEKKWNEWKEDNKPNA